MLKKMPLVYTFSFLGDILRDEYMHEHLIIYKSSMDEYAEYFGNKNESESMDLHDKKVLEGWSFKKECLKWLIIYLNILIG